MGISNFSPFCPLPGGGHRRGVLGRVRPKTRGRGEAVCGAGKREMGQRLGAGAGGDIGRISGRVKDFGQKMCHVQRS